MWRSIEHLRGYQAQTKDGTFGRVKDFYFDDVNWALRYMVLDTGPWLVGRRVLISPETFQTPDWENKIFPLSLSKKQIENSPSIDSDKPVSRQHEADLADYYNWAMYWAAPIAGGFGGALDQAAIESGQIATLKKGSDPHLRSVHEMKGYAINARDRHIGHLDDFIVDDEHWTIHYLVVDTRDWIPGRKVILSPQWIQSIRWIDRTIHVDLTEEQIRRSPPYNPSEAVNRAYEGELYDYYGRPKYW